ncbi:Uncharacterized protein APZ42_031027 [Daphnia magna]|uniref:Uncharacterized protein n=1 Tax=Daphnia magna TaxID=35525 RepID=A0A0P5DM90_9CRUS|nr:Uncharacterized protein APZ42_031027 [Daphnia magna]
MYSNLGNLEINNNNNKMLGKKRIKIESQVCYFASRYWTASNSANGLMMRSTSTVEKKKERKETETKRKIERQKK